MAAAPRGTWDPVAPGECGAGAARRGRGERGMGGNRNESGWMCGGFSGGLFGQTEFER